MLVKILQFFHLKTCQFTRPVRQTLEVHCTKCKQLGGTYIGVC